MDDLIQLLEDSSAAVSAVALKTSAPKTQRRLVICSLDLRNLAIVLRRGTHVVPEGAKAVCVKELRETLLAAKAAKNEEGYGRVLSEALESVDVVEQHMVVETAGMSNLAAALSARGTMQGLTPLPPDVFPPRFPRWPIPPRDWPFPWPPRPFPPSPWPPGPPPWFDTRGWESSGFQG